MGIRSDPASIETNWNPHTCGKITGMLGNPPGFGDSEGNIPDLAELE